MPRKRGGQPRNKNAYKHGFYSKYFNSSERKALSDIPITDITDHIRLLRVQVDRFMQAYTTSLDKLDYEERLEGLRAVTLAIGRIASLERIQSLSAKISASMQMLEQMDGGYRGRNSIMIRTDIRSSSFRATKLSRRSLPSLLSLIPSPLSPCDYLFRYRTFSETGWFLSRMGRMSRIYQCFFKEYSCYCQFVVRMTGRVFVIEMYGREFPIAYCLFPIPYCLFPYHFCNETLISFMLDRASPRG